MKTIKFIILFVLLSGTVLSQHKYQRDSRRELDSLKQIVLGPKLKLYEERVEKFTLDIKATKDKHRIKQYAKEIVQVSNTFEDEIAGLYNDGSSFSRSNVYVGVGMGMGGGWYPGMGSWMYPGSYSYSNLPPIYYDVDRIRKYANNIRLFTGSNNVNKKLGYIHKKVAGLGGNVEK